MFRSPYFTRRILRGLAAALAGCFLGGCLSLAPHYQRPTAPVAAEYPVSLSEPAGAAPLDWHDVFTDTDLRSTVETGLRNNRNLRIAILRVREARALRGVERGNRFPSINATAQGIRAGVPSNIGFPGLPGVISAYDVAAGASWELDFWGRVRDLDTAALENYLATDAARRAFTVSLVTQLADAWLQERELDQRIALARKAIASREESFRIFTRRYQEGSSTRLELSQVETLLTQAQALGAQLEQSRAINQQTLILLEGGPTPISERTGAFDAGGPVRPVAAGLPSSLLTSRPDIIAAEHRLLAAHANIGAARAAFLPRVNLTGSFGTSSPELDGLFDPGSRTWLFYPSITIPIFTGGRLRSSLDVAKVRREIAVADYESTVQGAFRDVADALLAQRWLSEQVGIQSHALRAQTERARLAQLRYDSGAATYLEVLDAQRDLLSVEQTLVQTQRALQSSRVSLFAALGGGALGTAD